MCKHVPHNPTMPKAAISIRTWKRTQMLSFRSKHIENNQSFNHCAECSKDTEGTLRRLKGADAKPGVVQGNMETTEVRYVLETLLPGEFPESAELHLIVNFRTL